MVRPFDLRDLALIRRMGERGVSLHPVSALVEDFHPLRGAIMNMLIGGDHPTFVARPNHGSQLGFIQLRIATTGPQAHVLYISPRLDGAESDNGEYSPETGMWLELLDEAVAGLGQRGIQHIIAEADEIGPELRILRRAGFAVYTRQDIWKVDADSYNPYEGEARQLVQSQAGDEWDLQLLYANTVPRLVQLAEPAPPLHEGNVWVLREAEDLSAFVQIRRGSSSAWLRFFIHPEAEADADAIVAGALRTVFTDSPRTVYCCVRRYESWLPTSLIRHGFEIWGSQAVMVRHTVHHLPRAMPEVVTVREGQTLTASSPLVRNFHPPETNGGP